MDFCYGVYRVCTRYFGIYLRDLHYTGETSGIISAASVICRYMTSMEKVKVENHVFSGGVWMAAWIFTIGFLQLSFWQGVWAVVIWPYYLGVALRPLFFE